LVPLPFSLSVLISFSCNPDRPGIFAGITGGVIDKNGGTDKMIRKVSLIVPELSTIKKIYIRR
jgi:hypothetical protein